MITAMITAMGRGTVELYSHTHAAPVLSATPAGQGPEVGPPSRVAGDSQQLPFRVGALTSARVVVGDHHGPTAALPLALAELHRAMQLGAVLRLGAAPGRGGAVVPSAHEVVPSFAEVVQGAGFDVVSTAGAGEGALLVEATRARLLPDTVGPGMRLLLVGLNPSLHTADAGYGYAGPGNRFWPAAMESGLLSRPKDPFHALRVDGVGMTNLVRRVTPRAAQLSRHEYREGADRLRRLVAWLQPATVCFVGVTGYRLAVDPLAGLGWQKAGFAGVLTYVMPNTSGLNAHTKPAGFTAHLRAARAQLEG